MLLFYLLGFLIALVAIIFAELIWIPAPLLLGGSIQWVEVIDWFYYGLIAIPLCWAAGGIKSLDQKQLPGLPKSKLKCLLYKINKWIILVLSVANILLGIALSILILIESRDYKLLLCLTIVSAVLAFIGLATGYFAQRKKKKKTFLFSMIGIAAAFCLVLFPIGYEVTYPGMTVDMNRYAAIEDGQPTGMINGVLVFERPAVMADWLYAQIFPQYELRKIIRQEPPLEEQFAQVIAMKQDANRLAEAIALQKTGQGSGVSPRGIRVMAVVKDGPADGQLQAGDVIEAINGQQLLTSESMVSYMEEYVEPGNLLDIQVRRFYEAEQLVHLSLVAGSALDQVHRAVLGVAIQTDIWLDAGRNVNYNDYLAHIGGPSHGAMLTLAFIDQLTPGGVLHHIRVAGTGTIELDGSVGMVGGIPQKAYAVSRTAAEVFFVPAAGAELARQAAPSLNIVPVQTIDDILQWVKEEEQRRLQIKELE